MSKSQKSLCAFFLNIIFVVSLFAFPAFADDYPQVGDTWPYPSHTDSGEDWSVAKLIPTGPQTRGVLNFESGFAKINWVADSMIYWEVNTVLPGSVTFNGTISIVKEVSGSSGAVVRSIPIFKSGLSWVSETVYVNLPSGGYTAYMDGDVVYLGFIHGTLTHACEDYHYIP